MGERDAEPAGQRREAPRRREGGLGDAVAAHRAAAAAPLGARAFRDAAEVFVGQQPLLKRREHDAARAGFPEHVEEAVALDPAVEHGIVGLVDEAGRPEPAQQGDGLGGIRRAVVGDPDVERLALADRVGQRRHALLQRRVRVGAVVVEDVHVVEPHPLQAGVEAGQQAFPRPPFPVGTRSHPVSGLGRDDELVPVGREVGSQDAAEALLGGAGRRAVVVGEVEMRDAAVEGAAQDRPPGLEGVQAAEVLPQAQRDRRQHEAAPAAAAVGHRLVAVGAGREDGVGHAALVLA